MIWITRSLDLHSDNIITTTIVGNTAAGAADVHIHVITGGCGHPTI